ncbi:hypothetical protein EUTSA_v10013000mg [Eutrema salsugineum]|uniref:Shugoshin C-terminal domain-containing protein n=1 Tax=Eutrema salsugineum TaxID=72664 RepID=V4LD58_EUTSA|nr:hypothetical protein EUTSA_v10013000mg [Eutrema salsugineum]
MLQCRSIIGSDAFTLKSCHRKSCFAHASSSLLDSKFRKSDPVLRVSRPASTMNSVTVLEDDNYAAQGSNCVILITIFLRIFGFLCNYIIHLGVDCSHLGTLLFLSRLCQIQKFFLSNIEMDLSKQMNREDTRQQQNMLFSSKEYAEKLQKAFPFHFGLVEIVVDCILLIRLLLLILFLQENMTLMKALAHRNKIIELSGVEFQKMRINLRNVQEKNLQFAQANSHMLAELNTNRDRLKQLQHELGCKNVLLEARKMQLEASYPLEQPLPCTHHASEDKVPSNVSDGYCKLFQALDMNRKDTKRKRTSRIKQSSNVKPILVKEDANSKRKASEVIDTSSIPEVTCQTENDFEKGVVANQIVDNVVTKKFDLDAANLVQDTVHSKRQCVRRKSTRFDFQETEQTEKLLEMEDAKEIKETARLSLRRRSARLRPEEAELCKNFHERDEVRETIKRRRVSSRKQSARFDFQEPEVIETLNADDAGSLVSDGSRSEAVKPSESRHDIKDTNGKRRVSMRRQPTKGKSQTATDTDGAIKEIAKDPSLRIDTVEECVLRSSSASKEDDHERESKKKPRAEETEGMMRRTSVGRPSRHAAEKVQSYREVSLKAKMRRNC